MARLAGTSVHDLALDWSQMAAFDEGTKSMMTDVIGTLDQLGWPVIDVTLPAGTTARGNPLGVQFIGRDFAEQFLIQAGHAFQQVTTFHRRRPPLALAGG